MAAEASFHGHQSSRLILSIKARFNGLLDGDLECLKWGTDSIALKMHRRSGMGKDSISSIQSCLGINDD